MARRKPLIAAGLLILVLVGGGGAYALRGRGDGATTDARVKVATGPLAVVLAETGSIQPLSKVEVKSKVAGQVARLLVDVGRHVQKGELLIQLDTIEMDRRRAQMIADRDIFAAQLSRLRAGARPQELAQARAQLARATAVYQRAHGEFLRSRGAFAAQTIASAEAEVARANDAEALAQLEDARARWSLVRAGSRPEELAEARARLARANAALDDAEDQLSFAAIRAPMTGTVIRRGIEVGEMVSPGVSATAQGTSMLTIADLGRLLIFTNLNQIDVGKVRLGQLVDVRVDSAPGKKFRGRIHKIAPAADKAREGDADAIQTFPIETLLGTEALQSADGREVLKPGMSADLDIHVASKPRAVYLPVEAVVRGKGNEGTVSLPPAKKGDKVPTQAVTIGLTNDHQVEILTGLTAGQEVLIKPPSSADNAAKF